MRRESRPTYQTAPVHRVGDLRIILPFFKCPRRILGMLRMPFSEASHTIWLTHPILDAGAQGRRCKPWMTPIAVSVLCPLARMVYEMPHSARLIEKVVQGDISVTTAALVQQNALICILVAIMVRPASTPHFRHGALRCYILPGLMGSN